jgi:hypothetical protein
MPILLHAAVLTVFVGPARRKLHEHQFETFDMAGEWHLGEEPDQWPIEID